MKVLLNKLLSFLKRHAQKKTDSTSSFLCAYISQNAFKLQLKSPFSIILPDTLHRTIGNSQAFPTIVGYKDPTCTEKQYRCPGLEFRLLVWYW